MVRQQPDGPEAVPGLDPGVTVLRRPSRSPALHRLVVSELRDATAPAYWIDSGNEASTHVLYDLAPAERVLDDLRVARAFTAHQHHALVRRVLRRVADGAGLVVVPLVADLYREDDVPDWEGEELLASALAMLSAAAETYDLPVLVSTGGEDEPAAVASAADAEIRCRETRFGLAYESDGFETRVYWRRGGWQTTIPYWVDLLGAVADEDPVAAAVDAGWPTVEG